MVPVTELVEHLRLEVLRDSRTPVLFSDAALIKYLSDAYKLFARRTHCFINEDVILLDNATNKYPTLARTIFVRQVSIDGRWLTSFTRRAKPRELKGRPRAYTTDVKHRQIKFAPWPDKAYTAVVEYVEAPRVLSLNSRVDLDEDWAYLLTQYAAYRALQTNDPDGSDQVDAIKFRDEWSIGLRDAKRDYMRQSMGESPSAQPRVWT